MVRWCSQEFSLGLGGGGKEVVGFQILKQTNELWTGQNCGMGGKEEGCGKFVFFPPHFTGADPFRVHFEFLGRRGVFLF